MVFLVRNYVRVARVSPFRSCTPLPTWAALLRELKSRQAVYLPIAPSALEGVRVLNCQTGGLP